MAEDPAIAAYAWARFARVQRWLLAATVAPVLAAWRLAAVHASSASVRRCAIAALLAGSAMLLGSAAMGVSYLLRRWRQRRAGAGGSPPPARRPADAPE